jgi:cell division protein FtsW (lipid II flippase)
MLVLALWVGKDKGPILVQAVAVVVMLGGMMLASPGGRRWLPAGFIAGVIVVAVGLLALSWLLFSYAPPERLAALTHPYQGKLEFLSEIHWFMHAVPAQGFGLTQVPWCGYAGSLGSASCVGVPQQIQSDYVFAALVGIFGPQQATLLIALLLLWLGSLVLSQGQRTPGAVFDMSSFVTWLIASGATAYAVQTVISCLGTLGAIPLTGVSIPLFAYGGASLMTLSMLTGLAVNRLPVVNLGNSVPARSHSSLS